MESIIFITALLIFTNDFYPKLFGVAPITIPMVLFQLSGFALRLLLAGLTIITIKELGIKGHEPVLSIVVLTVLISIFAHGLSAVAYSNFYADAVKNDGHSLSTFRLLKNDLSKLSRFDRTTTLNIDF